MNLMMRNSIVFNIALSALGFFPALLLAAGPATQPAGSGIMADVSSLPPAEQSASPTDSTLSTAPAVSNVGSPVASTAGDTASGDEQSPRRPDRSENAQTGRGRFGQRIFGPVSPKELADAMIYMKEHSPNRAAAIESLTGERKNHIMEVAARNYTNWMRILKQDPQLYKVVVKRVEVEDNIFGLVSQLRKGSAATQASPQSDTRAKLREQVADLVDLGIEERQIRLDHLEQTVKDLRTKLDDDSSHRSDLIDQRYKTILSDGKSLLPSSGAGGGRAGGAGDNGRGLRPGELGH
jgi:hypothetical protein